MFSSVCVTLPMADDFGTSDYGRWVLPELFPSDSLVVFIEQAFDDVLLPFGNFPLRAGDS